jgi:molybdopterin-guanine dinucleotide biosynthesis protein A
MPTAAILAGGSARRFAGRDKSALLVDGRSILDRQIAQLSLIADDILLVGRAGEGTTPTGSAANGRFRLVHDRVPGCGPLGGLDAALAATRDDALLVVACDMPYVTAPFLLFLLTLKHEADAVVPRTEHGYHPLCAVYTRACQTEVVRCLADRRLKMTQLLENVRVRDVLSPEIEPFGDRHRLLANVNTPAEYGDLEAFQGHQL